LLYGTPDLTNQASTNGLWSSNDSGSTWSKVSGFTALSNAGRGAGVAFIAVYKPPGNEGAAGRTLSADVSIGQATSALYRSTDGGTNWAPVAGGPSGLMPQRGLIGPDGNLYITYGNAIGPNGMTAGQVWKYSIGFGTWQN